jgi:hypothetical protein
MPTADKNSTPTRRTALRFSVAALAAGLTTPVIADGATPDADAALIAICAEAVRYEARLVEIARHGTSEEDCDDACVAWDEIFERVARTSATTLPGIRAKAQILHLAVVRETVLNNGFNQYLKAPEEIEDHLRLDAFVARSLCSDILAMGGVAWARRNTRSTPVAMR